jgi:GH25 family lysozyme M1 (1,4-beta-N-acetylmuramidase)
MRHRAPTILQQASGLFGPKSGRIATADISAPVKGFDISKWTIITNAQQALAGMTFAIIRARDGIRDDTSWAVNKALAQQLPFWGAYAFFNPRFLTNEAPSGGMQASELWKLIGPSRVNDGMNIPPVIDCENSPNFTMPPASRYLHELKLYVDWLTNVLGRRPIVYSNLSFFDGYLEAHIDKPTSGYEAERNKSWLRECPLWIARPTTAAAPGLPKAWSKWAFWQYKLDNSTHPGLSVADENYWAGSVDQLAAWCKSADTPIPVWGEVVTPPPPPPPPPPVTDPTLKALQEQIDALKVGQSAQDVRLDAIEARPVGDHIHPLQAHTHDVGPAR